MKKWAALAVVFLGCGLGSAQQTASTTDTTAALKSGYDISMGGATRRLEVVTHEIAVKQADGRRTIMPATSGDARREARAQRAKAAATQEVEIVLTEPVETTKRRRSAIATRHFVTREVLVRLKAGATAKNLASKAALRIAREPAYAPGLVILDAGTSEDALTAMEALRTLPEVESADVILATQKAKKFTPNDPLFSEQWHHRNTTQLGGALWIDANITPAWDIAQGTGVTIAIVDDGLEHAHPDLQPNYNTALDYDFNGNDADPAPVNLVEDSHGTACAGVAAARGNNGIGVSGAAPLATLAGLRLIAAPSTDQQEANAFLLNNDVIQVKSNSWGMPDGSGYSGPEPLARAALETGATTGRGGKGVVYVFASGNGLDIGDNSNLDGYANNPFVLAVTAVNDFGFQAWYSEPGANILISAPSSGGGQNQGVRTTDLMGENGRNTSASTGELADRSYTNDFGGTSSACPLVAGVVALMLEANPNLGWRDVKEILIRTARKNHRADPEWATNGAGFSFNHKYGAGMVDAAAAVALAQQWTNLPAMTSTEVAQTGIATTIPDNNATGITRTLNLSTANFRVEHVSLTVNATHTAVGDLEITLTSPSGTVSNLAQMTPDGTNNLNWTFGSVRHWGENAAGSWTVTVKDRAPSDFGTLNSLTLKCHGTTQTGARVVGAGATLTAEGNTPVNSAADPGEAVTFSLGLKNIGGSATSSLTATLLPLGGVRDPGAAQSYGALATGGAVVTRSFSFKPHGGCGTSAALILHLQDGTTNLGFATLTVPLGTTTSSSFTGGSIAINDNQPASPSPSNLGVSGLVGRVQRLTAEVNGFFHQYMDDAGLLLRGPEPVKIRLMCGGPQQMGNASVTFDDNAPLIFPFYGALQAGSYRPWDYYGPYHATSNPSGRAFTGDSAAELAYTLGEFLGVPANGTWKLFVQDFYAGDGGTISNWKLNFTTVTCTDNVMLAQAASSDSEAVGALAVAVTRTGGLEGSATVNYATSNGSATAGSDYTSTNGTLTFAAGELTKTFSIPITNDSVQEANETIQVTLSAAGGNTTLGMLTTGTVTILDNDTPTPVALRPLFPQVTEADTTLTFTVSRSVGGTTGTVDWSTAPLTATPGADYQSGSGTLTFSANDLSQTFAVTIFNDALPEDGEFFEVLLQSPTGGLSLEFPPGTAVTIEDADTDGDSLVDDYETSVGLNVAVNDTALDLDGDGVSNLNEFIVGSAPNSGASQFRPMAGRNGNDVSIAFPSLSGRTYKVEMSQSPAPPWETLQANIPGTGSSITVPDVGAALLTRKFYRVIVTKP
ncbi:MAG: S8 family serine peptidase [Prosthecobacter sp.]